jgi:hypothetical protein
METVRCREYEQLPFSIQTAGKVTAIKFKTHKYLPPVLQNIRT